MARFLKGTTDHDSDGKMGGSRKETDMTASKTKAAPAVIKTKDLPAVSPKADSSAHKVQAGMEPGPSPKEQRAKLNEQFEAADEKGKAAIIEETQAGLGVRGY